MKLLSKTTNRFIISFCLFLFNYSVYGQQEPAVIELASDKSGYLDFSEDTENLGPQSEVIPTIKGELTVTEQGQATYNIPVEIYKGVNDFQPNLALAYNSQSGDGQVGIGWNLVGLSSITIGGKSKRIDGTNEGVQYDSTDPFYLDGQRLIQVGTSNEYVTEQYNQIKVTRTDTNTFKVQYTDGKVAIYKYKVKGQYLIDNFQDAFNNKIFYIYTITTGVPYISTIKYGGSTAANSPFTISFTYLDRLAPLKIYRKGEVIVSSKYLERIVVSSTAETLRKYILDHDNTSTKAERLRKVEVENGDGDKLKPLIFNYNLESGHIQTQTSFRVASGFNSTTKHLGNVAYGDFEGSGDLTAVYVTNTSPDYFAPGVTSQYSIMSSKYGEIETGTDSYYNNQKVFSGRIKESNGKFSTEDKLLQVKTDPNVFNYVTSGGGYIMNRKYHLNARSLNVTNSQINSSYWLGLGYEFLRRQVGHEGENWDGVVRGENLRVIETPYFELTNDFNSDGLVDRIVFVPPAYTTKNQENVYNLTFRDHNVAETFSSTKAPAKIYFFEVGKNINSPTLTPIITTGIDFDKDSDAYPIEFNGDMIPEILLVNRNTNKFSVYKIKGGQLIPLLQNQSLINFDKKTPLIFGDFNGDGLTDFITPNKLYSIENSDVNTLVNNINSPQEEHKWRQYISTGIGFNTNERDFKNQKLAYCVPSHRPIIVEDRSASFWKNLWGGAQYTVNETEYAACGVVPVDYNNDGRTDLVSFTKFGTMAYKDLLKDSFVKNNVTPSTTTSFANKIRLIENVPNNTTNIEFDLTVNTQNVIPLDETKISPLSLLVNTTESRGIEASKSILKFIDPVQRKEIRIDINNTEFLENQIQEIDNGSGVKQKIEYAPASTIVRNGNYVTSSLYYKANPQALGSLGYPFYINKHQPNYLLVKRINTIFDGTAISKEYRYENAVQNFDGKGFLGFIKTKVSDPYESKWMNGEYLPARPFEGVLWTINTRNPQVDNAVVRTEYGSLDGVDILTLHEKNINKYERGLRYVILETSSSAQDFLKNVIISKSYTYRENSDLLLERVWTNHNNEYSTESTFGYKPSFTSGDHFFYGKINLNQETISKSGATFTTKDEYDFFPANGAPSIHKKYGNNTNPLITEYTYFANGNLQTEKISGTGITSLTTTYAYETTNRYVNKITAPDGLISQYEYSQDLSGELEKETSPLGLITRYGYDGWSNKTKVIDFLGLHTDLIKEQLQNGEYTLSTVKTGSPTTVVKFDRFDRPVKTKTQSINGKWLVSDIVYDIYGKKIKESEPYFEDAPNILWNEFEYDALDRLILLKDYTGKETTTCYEGMTVTVEDGDKKTSKTLDVMGNVIKHVDMGGEVLYDYYPNGTLKEADYDGITISINQDGWGNKTRLEDPSAGTYTYTYDILGRQLTEVTPKGQTTYVYDSFGKLITETSTGDETNITATYEYDAVTKLPKKITGSNGTNSFTYETSYDQYHRINGKKETLTGAFMYETTSVFDPVYGRLETTELKTTVTINGQNKVTTSKIENIYEISSGILIEQRDFTANRRIWKINEVNQKGQTKKMIYGNNFLLTNEYDDYFLPTKIKDQNGFTNQTALEIDYIFDPQKRRLNSRNIHVFTAFEKFDYDDLDRLISEKVNNVVMNEYTYDVRGRMTYNKEIGTYEYGNSDYQIEKFKFNAQGQTLMNNRGIHQLKFNAFKQATEIYLPGKDRVNYGFNIFKKRAVAYYGGLQVNPASRPKRKFYTSDNAVEILFNAETNETDIITYVDGDPYNSAYIKVDKFTGVTLNTSTNYYLHRDYQGSILALSNTAGRVVEQRWFDAWGNIKQVKHTTWNGTTPTVNLSTELKIIDRGYTGHEHLTVGLIHMNGRLYDPVIRRFLSPDNFVQDPYNTQNFDRYSYVYNNPLIYTDPSGEEITMGVAILISVAVSILSTGIDNLINGVPFWYGMGKSAAMAAVSGAISFGIGTAAQTITSTAGKMAFQAAAHGVSGGIMSDLQGGSFDSGFLSGAVSSLVSSGVIAIGEAKNSLSFYGRTGWSQNTTAAVTIAAGSLSGGISSVIAGGNFWSGARQGFITSGFNHVAHIGAKYLQKANTIVAGIYGAGGEDLLGNSDLRDIVERKGGKMFQSNAGENDQEIIDYLTEAYHEHGKFIEIYGYSRGGNAAIRITNKLGELGINVSKLITYDAHNLNSPLHFGLRGGGSFSLKHNNVGMAVNYYQQNYSNTSILDNPFFGGSVSSDYINVVNHNYTNHEYNGAPVNHNNVVDYATKNCTYGCL